MVSLLASSSKDDNVDRYEHIRKKSSTKKQYSYLDLYPLFHDQQFQEMFRITRFRFQGIIEDVKNSPSSISYFFLSTAVIRSQETASFEAKLLISL